jgi:hypothetical protein
MPSYSATLGLQVTTGKRMNLAANIALNDCTCFGVYSNASSLIAFTDSFNSTPTNSEARSPLYWSGWSGGAWSSSLIAGAAPNILFTGAFTGPQVLRFQRESTTFKFAIGTSVTTKTCSTAAVNIQTPIGNLQTNLPSNYRLRELVLYARSLADADITSIYEYLKVKWGTP